MTVAKRPTGPKLTISITQKLIEESKQRDSSHCMIAEAVKGVFPTAKAVSVDIQTIRFTDPERKLRFTYLTPRRAQEALVSFDQGITPEQFRFQLRQPQVTISGSRTTGKRAMSEAQRASVQKNLVESRRRPTKNAKALQKTTLRSGSTTATSTRTGGRTPPTTPFARRRAFGLRGLEF